MCKLIAELVGSDKNVVKEVIERLENRSGLPGVDVRLTSEIYGSAHMKARALGLDPHDTTAQELYHALVNLTKLHDVFIAKRIGTINMDTNNDVIEHTTLIANKLKLPTRAWAIKSASARKLLVKLPPKNLKKLLGYRSLDSLLKREQPLLLLAAATYTEPKTWQTKLKGLYKKLAAIDFEPAKIQAHYLGTKKWSKAADYISSKSNVHVLSSLETATVLTLPVAGRLRPGICLMTLTVVLHGFNELKTIGSLIKFHQMRPDLGDFLVDIINHDSRQYVQVAGQDVHWRSVHRHFGRQKDSLPAIFQPHIQPADIAYRQAEEVLFRLEPALEFWNSLDCVGWPLSSGPVSFSLMDNVNNLVNNLPFEQRAYHHLERAVWDELYSRYLSQGSLEDLLLTELDSQAVKNPVLSDMEFVL